MPTLYAVYGVFTLLMNLHDFVTEPFNPVHIFRDAHTVPFCLTADHSSTSLMSLCTLQVSTVLVCSYRWDTIGNGSSALIEYHGELDVEVVSTHGVVGVFILMECHEVFGGRNVQHLLVCGQ